jgi:hypothetical protein
VKAGVGVAENGELGHVVGLVVAIFANFQLF